MRASTRMRARAGRPRGLFEPLQHRAAHAAALLRPLHREQQQVRVVVGVEMTPNATTVPGGPTTMTLVSGSAIAWRTRGSRQVHGRPCSISSRDNTAIAAASAGVAKRMVRSEITGAGAQRSHGGAPRPRTRRTTSAHTAPEPRRAYLWALASLGAVA